MIRIHHHRRHTANHSWHLDLAGRQLFVKANPNRRDADAAVAGHHRLTGWFPIPRLHAHIPLGPWTITVYDRHDPGRRSSGLLLDVITDTDRTGDLHHLDQVLDHIIRIYQRAYAETLQHSTTGSLIDKLYRDRARPGGRLDRYYAANPLLLTAAGGPPLHASDLATHRLTINGSPESLDLTAIRQRLRAFFAPDHRVWAAIGHGDPTDLNIAVSDDNHPIWFDHDTGGLTPIAGEMACFLMYQRLHGSLLVPRYNPTAYTDHPAARDHTPPRVRLRHFPGQGLAIDYEHRPSPARQHVIRRYLNELVALTAARIDISDILAWLRPYLVMRLLAVYPLADLNSDDTALSLALCAQLMNPTADLESVLGLTTTGLRQ